MDVTAILAALGSIANTVGTNINIDGKTYNDIRKQEGAPLKKDWFGQYKTNNTSQYFNIVLMVIIAIMLGIVALAFSKNKN